MSGKAAAGGPRPFGKRVLRLAIWAALLAVVFGWLLPQLIDYGQVWAAIKRLSWSELAILVALGLLRIPTEAMMYQGLLPELPLGAAMRTWLMVNGSSVFLPPPADSVAFYALTRAQRIEARRAVTASFLTFVYPTAGRLLLPIIAAVPYLIFAARDDETLPLLAITLAVAGAAGVLGYLVIRSERTAYRLGDGVSHVFNRWAARARRLLRRADKPPAGSLGPTLARFRDDAIEVVQSNWPRAVVGVAANFAVIYVILLLSLRFVGLSAETLPWVEVFAAFALSQWAQTVVPISPGGLGIADAVLVSSLGAIAGRQSGEIAAAIVLWRMFSWALPIPIGLVAIRRWQAAHPNALAEAREALHTAPR